MGAFLVGETMDKEKPEYFIELSHNNGKDRILFPVLPEQLEIKRKGRGETFDIIGLGQINVIHSKELSEISFESFFPANGRAPYVIHSALFKSPGYLVKKISRWQESQYPSRITIKAPNMKLTLAVSIEQFDRRAVAGTDDIEFQISFREYKFYAPRRLKVGTKPAAAAGTTATAAKPTTTVKDAGAKRPDERVPATTYKLKPGENLWSVAKKQLGDENRWKEIQKLNNIKDADLKKLQAGMMLKLPPKK
ncbi:LysM domain-containing protein [Paenibacillaceae bacterium]|nr:LysM domain-containing protein [Paenibacillaceae bacterium]